MLTPEQKRICPGICLYVVLKIAEVNGLLSQRKKITFLRKKLMLDLAKLPSKSLINVSKTEQNYSFSQPKKVP